MELFQTRNTITLTLFSKNSVISWQWLKIFVDQTETEIVKVIE